MFDYKYAAQMQAEELADQRGVDFFALTPDEQSKLYSEGLDDVVENMLSRADQS